MRATGQKCTVHIIRVRGRGRVKVRGRGRVKACIQNRIRCVSFVEALSV
jgi:hypothetical protein